MPSPRRGRTASGRFTKGSRAAKMAAGRRRGGRRAARAARRA